MCVREREREREREVTHLSPPGKGLLGFYRSLQFLQSSCHLIPLSFSSYLPALEAQTDHRNNPKRKQEFRVCSRDFPSGQNFKTPGTFLLCFDGSQDERQGSHLLR